MPDLTLEEKDRQKLDSIVGQMVSNKESDDAINFVVLDFKRKYGKEAKATPLPTLSQQSPDLGIKPIGTYHHPEEVGGQGAGNVDMKKRFTGVKMTPQGRQVERVYESASGFNPIQIKAEHPETKHKDVKQAAWKDKDENDNYLAALWNKVVDSGERLAGGLVRGAYNLNTRMQPGVLGQARAEIAQQVDKERMDAGQPRVETELSDNAKGFIDNARLNASSRRNEENIASGFDLTNGSFKSNIKALPLMAAGMLADMGAAITTGGASFALQGYDDALSEIDKIPEAANMSEGTRQAFGIAGGVVNGVLEKVGLDKILKNTGATKFITAKVTKEVTEELAQKGIKATAEQFEKMVLKKSNSAANRILDVVAHGGQAGAIEGLTETGQEGLMDLSRLAVNAAENHDIFDEDEMNKTAAKRYLTSLAAGGILGGIGGAVAGMANTHGHISEKIDQAKTPEEVSAVLAEVDENIADGTIHPEDAEDLKPVIEQQVEKKMSEFAPAVIMPEENKEPNIVPLKTEPNEEAQNAETQEVNDTPPTSGASETIPADEIQSQEQGNQEAVSPSVVEVGQGNAEATDVVVDKSLTKEAQDLLNGLNSGSKPTFITKNLERIAKDNGINVTDKMSADDVINALKEKQKPIANETTSENNTANQPGNESPKAEIATATELNTEGQEAKDGGGEPPKEGAVDITTESGETVGVTHAAMDHLAEEMGLPDRYEKNPSTVEEWDAKAKERIAKGEMPKLINDMENGHRPSEIDERMILHHVAALKYEYNKNPTIEIEKQFRRIKALNDLAGQQWGKEGRARQGELGVHPLDGGLLSSVDYFKEKNGVDELTPTQKEEVSKLVEKYKAAAENEKAKREELEQKYNDFLAEQEVNKAKSSTKWKSKKTKEDYVKERKQIVNDIREKLRQSRGQANDIVTASVDFLKITPDVLKLVKSLVEETIDIKLPELIQKAHEIVSEAIPEVTPQDIHDMIAGKYREPKEKRNELAARMMELQTEASLLNEYQRVLNGQPKTERERTKKNQRLSDLRKKIKEEDIDSKLTNIINANKRATEKLKERIAKGDFETNPPIPLEENEAFKKANRDLYNEALNSTVAKEDVRHEFDIAAHKAQMKRWAFGKKAGHFVNKVVRTMQSLKAGIDDSFMFVQAGYTVVTNLSVGIPAIKEHIKDASGIDSRKDLTPRKVLSRQFVRNFFSGERFARSVAGLRNKDAVIGNLMKNSGVAILEPQSLSAKAKEEMFAPSFLDDEFTVNGKKESVGKYTTKPFERAYASLGNNMRAGLFLKMAYQYMLEGHTFENNSKKFKDLGLVVNNLTGRGSFYKGLEHIATNPITTFFIWSPRMIASGINLLGITDLQLLVGSKNGFYTKLDPQVRKFALTQMADGIAVGVGIMAAVAIKKSLAKEEDKDFYDVDFDPTSPTGLTIKIGNNRIGVFGRYTSIAKAVIQASLGERTTAKGVEDLDDKGGHSRMGVLGSFMRGKMTPTAGFVYDLAQNEDYYTHKPKKLSDVPKDLMLPMTFDGVVDQVKKDGWVSTAFKMPFTITGLNISDEREFYKNELGGVEGEYLEQHKVRIPQTTNSIPKDDNHPTGKMTDQEFEKFNKDREALVKDGVAIIMKKGWVDDTGKRVTPKELELNNELMTEAVKKIASKANEIAKDKLEGKKDRKAERGKDRASYLRTQLLGRKFNPNP